MVPFDRTRDFLLVFDCNYTKSKKTRHKTLASNLTEARITCAYRDEGQLSA